MYVDGQHSAPKLERNANAFPDKVTRPTTELRPGMPINVVRDKPLDAWRAVC